MRFNTTGSNNTVTGYKALYANITGSGNVAIGYQAGYSETGSNKLYISNSQSNNLLYGDFSSGQLDLGKTSGTVTTLNDFNVDGDATFDGTATVTGATTLTGAVTASSTLAVTGAATFSDDATISGTLALGDLTDVESSINTNSTNISSNDTDIASNASSITTNASNISSNDTDIASNTTSITTINNTTLARFSSGARVYSNTGDENTALGDVSLNTIIAGGQSGKHNVAIGAGTMYNLTSGSYNTALGQDALYSSTSGSYNVALGRHALYDNVTGDRNTALGYRQDTMVKVTAMFSLISSRFLRNRIR